MEGESGGREGKTNHIGSPLKTYKVDSYKYVAFELRVDGDYST